MQPHCHTLSKSGETKTLSWRKASELKHSLSCPQRGTPTWGPRRLKALARPTAWAPPKSQGTLLLPALLASRRARKASCGAQNQGSRGSWQGCSVPGAQGGLEGSRWYFLSRLNAGFRSQKREFGPILKCVHYNLHKSKFLSLECHFIEKVGWLFKLHKISYPQYSAI